jgi:hypothetical protein
MVVVVVMAPTAFGHGFKGFFYFCPPGHRCRTDGGALGFERGFELGASFLDFFGLSFCQRAMAERVKPA